MDIMIFSKKNRRILIGLLVLTLALIVSPVTADGPNKEIRFATFNASLNRNNAGQLIADLSTPDNVQAQTVAEIIQRTRPDVLLINEFDFDATGEAARLFQDNYLSVSQNGAEPITYAYHFVAPSNTGIPSGFDLDNNGAVGGPNDAFGFGFFEGQFGMAVYSRYPIDYNHLRTFQQFLWKDMPGALLPDDPTTPEPADWYSAEELDVFRLSSKSHWDVPINVGGKTVHFLVSHPTPPVFDGPEDRNGTRNSDEIRFWADYIDPARSDYIYDDQGGHGGLDHDALFVIAGDQNSDPFDGDSIPGSAQQLTEHPLINNTVIPASLGGPEQAAAQGGANATHLGDPAFDTADFADNAPGNLRADYVLPQKEMVITDAAIFWPASDDPLFGLVGLFPFPSSDHRLVWIDVTLPEAPVCTNILDDFNRKDGRLGRNWRGATYIGDYKLVGQQVEALSGKPIYWKSNDLGADQEACITLTQIDQAGHHGLLLKTQRAWQRGTISVFYKGETQEVGIETYVRKKGWTTLATVPMTLQAGDQLAGRAWADGTVQLFVNGELVGEANAGPAFVDKGGSIGLWFISPSHPHAFFDDFGGK